MRHLFSAGSTSTSAGGATAISSATAVRRSFAILSAAAMAATTLFAVTAADAAVTVGPGRTDGVPNFVRDSNGIALQLCSDAVLCEPPAAGELAGYFEAGANVGPLRATWAIEAGFLEDAAGNPTTRVAVANVASFDARGLRPNRRYTIRGPWGTHRCLSDVRGRLDCLFERGGEAGGPLRIGPVKSFLVGRFSPAGFISGLEVTQRVKGSPTGFNRVTFTGPGVNARTSLFTLSGQLRDNTAMGLLSRTHMRLGSRNGVQPRTKRIRYENVGTAPARVRVQKTGQRAAFRVVNHCRSVAPGRTCSIRVTYKRARHDKAAALRITDNSMARARTVQLRGIARR